MIFVKTSERSQDEEVRELYDDVQSESEAVLGKLECLMDRGVSQELMVR